EAICGAMDLLLGDHEGPLPTPIGLIEMANRPKRRAQAAAAPTASTEEPTKPKLAAVGADDYDDKTEIDSNMRVGDSGADTEPNARNPLLAGSSDTPTERTTADELPTQIKRTSDRIPVDPSKRA